MSKHPNSANHHSTESEVLTVRSNKISSALDLLNKKNRILRSEFLVEGPHSVEEVVKANLCKHVFVTRDFALTNNKLMSEIAKKRIDIYEAEDLAIEKLSETLSPQGIIAVADFVATKLEDEDIDIANFAVVLSNVRDPGNAGTIIRVADAAGADLVVFAGTSVDPHNGKVVRASAGSIFNLPVRQDSNVGQVLESFQKSGKKVFIADGVSKKSWDEVDLTEPLVWVMGNEAWGIKDEDAPVGTRVSIPIYGKAESLNVATAAALCLYETAKKRHSN